MNTYLIKNDIFAYTQKSLDTSADPWAFIIQDSESEYTSNHLGKPILHSEICSFIADWELPKMELVD